jgi:hypothetical protein
LMMNNEATSLPLPDATHGPRRVSGYPMLRGCVNDPTPIAGVT